MPDAEEGLEVEQLQLLDGLEAAETSDDAGAEAEGGCEDSSDEDCRGSNSRRGRGKAAKAKAKSSAAAAAATKKKVMIIDERGRCKKNIQNPKKRRPPCAKLEPVDNFPKGSGQCGDGRRIMQNLMAASVAQGQVVWYDEVVSDAKQLAKVVAAYRACCPPAPAGKKRNPFVVLKYSEEVKQGTVHLVGRRA